jgi:hypothetical protein
VNQLLYSTYSIWCTRRSQTLRDPCYLLLVRERAVHSLLVIYFSSMFILYYIIVLYVFLFIISTNYDAWAPNCYSKLQLNVIMRTWSRLLHFRYVNILKLNSKQQDPVTVVLVHRIPIRPLSVQFCTTSSNFVCIAKLMHCVYTIS